MNRLIRASVDHLLSLVPARRIALPTTSPPSTEVFPREDWLTAWTILGAAGVHGSAAFTPFSSSSTGRAGKGLAMQEMRMAGDPRVFDTLHAAAARWLDGWRIRERVQGSLLHDSREFTYEIGITGRVEGKM